MEMPAQIALPNLVKEAERCRVIRYLNDQLRQRHIGGRVILTAAITALGIDAVRGIVGAVANFDAFDHNNDPYEEHDFGLVTFEGREVMFKIDPYDIDLVGHSPDAADPAVTLRVLTIILAEEY
jgi:hypothetical protein